MAPGFLFALIIPCAFHTNQLDPMLDPKCLIPMTDTTKEPNRNYQLVSCVTPDTVKLHGLFQDAARPETAGSEHTERPVDAAVVLHGLGGNFYSSSLNLRLADSLRDQGIAVVLGNMRGHDGISMSPVGGRAQTIGAAYEIVDDCKNDVAGWVNWLVEKKGFRNIALVGHSLGAIKSLYAQANLPTEKVKLIIGLSATRLCHSQLLKSDRADDFRKWFAKAEELVQAGRHDELMRVDFPFPTHMAAGAYRDKYGPEDRYDWTRYVDRIKVPTLLLFGERELSDNAAFHGMLQLVEDIAKQNDHFKVEVIESANHFYAGVHWRATDVIKNWLAGFSQTS